MGTEHFNLRKIDGNFSAKLHRDLNNLADDMDGALYRESSDLKSVQEETKRKVDNIHIDVSTKPYEVKGLNVQHDTDMMKQAITDAGVGGTLFLPYSFEVNDTLSFLDNQQVKGKGITISANIALPVILPPRLRGTIDEVTIDGKGNTLSTGVLLDDTHYPYNATWGKISIQNCGVGFRVALTTKGGAYSKIKYLSVKNCTVGMDLNPTGTGWFNANEFGYVFLYNCSDTGIKFNDMGDGVDGNTFAYLQAEMCGVGIDAIQCESTFINSGWLEDNVTKNIKVAIYPAVNNFVYWGSKDDQNDAKSDYAFSRETSNLMVRKNGGNFMAMRGRWYFDELDTLSNNEFSGRINNPILNGFGMSYKESSSGATIDVTGYNAVYLSYTAATVITNLVRSGGFATHRSARYQMVILVAKNGNATVSNSSSIRLSGGTSWVPTNGATLTLIYEPNIAKWIEIARTT